MTGSGRDLPARSERPDPPALSRRLGGDEVDAILRRASSAENSPHVPSRTDLTVAELMEVAEEVGLDPLAVRRSASIEPLASTGAVAAVLGAPDHREVRATLHAGLPVDRRALVSAAEKVLGRKGEVVTDTENSFVWRETHGVGRTTVSSSGEPGAGLTITADRTGHYLVHWFGGLLGWAGVSTILPLTLGPLAATLLFLATPMLLARPFWQRSDRATLAKLDDLAMELLRVADETEGPP